MEKLTFDVISKSLSEVGFTVIVVVLAALLIEVVVYLLLGKVFKSKYTIPIMLLTPAIIGISILVVVPLFFELGLAFSNMMAKIDGAKDFFRNPDFGIVQLLDNIVKIFTAPILRSEYFFPIFLRTMLWTGIQVFFHVVGGLGLALLLNREIKGRGLYRTLLVIPWAVPQVVAVLAWRGEFHFVYGVFNNILKTIGLAPIQWKSDWFWNIVAMNMTNIWLGIPFMMVILLGGLQSIPKDFYEAAEIDGANAYSRFKNITLPMLQPVMTPAIILGIIWTFNNFNVPYFINENKLETSDILATALFRAAFESPNRYGFAAAFAFVIFAILFIMSLIQLRVTGAADDITGGAIDKAKKTKVLRKRTVPAEVN